MTVRLADFVAVAPRYTRAINLERDAGSAAGVSGYVVTTTANDFLGRFGQSLTPGATHRAWTLTGPYGSGKSAFTLYLSQLLGPAASSNGKLARSMLRQQMPDTYRDLFERSSKTRVTDMGFCSVLVGGAPEPILGALLKACCRDLRRCCAGSRRRALKKLEGFRDRFEAGQAVSPSEVIETVSDLALNLQKTGRAQGVLLVIDELGKFLEYAARDPERGDIFVLQQFAEATARAESPSLFVITVLHQSFERYAADLRPTMRDEWSKVQGRFEDVSFQERAEEVLDLLSSAIQPQKHAALKRMREQARSLAEKAVALHLMPPGMSKLEFTVAMERCAPLHPLAALVLARLCRKFGQNQRSLFSFLVSREPHGFGTFLTREGDAEDVPFYGLPELYDYVAEALGNGLGVGEGAARWAEVQSTLDKAVNSTSEEIQIIKTVGLLSAIGIYGEVKPSVDVLTFAWTGGARGFQRSYRALLQRSILIERKHNGTVALWEGSDIDLDDRLKEAARRVVDAGSLAEKLNGMWALRPLVAKRHSFQTGTLRYFAVRFAEASTFTTSLEVGDGADGLLLYCLPGGRAEAEQLMELAQENARDQLEVLVAIPQEVGGLRESVRELELLQWVQANTPELQGDAVARRELRSRLAVVEGRSAQEIQHLFSPDELRSRATQWFHHGIRQEIGTSRTLANFLSDICDSVYAHTPVLRNELINRRTLSSAAAAARRNLIDAMIRRGSEPRLGIEGTPPELSMYASILERTGIHRLEEAGYAFGEPQSDAGLQEVWREMERFFGQCELHRRSVADLFGILGRRPYGLKMGVAPVLFCAAALAHDTDIAFYENGSFVPELGVECFERLLRSPDKFELRRYRVEGVRREVFKQMAQLFGGTQSETHDLVAIMRPLYRFFARLPVYSRQTKRISPTAIAVRDCLLQAKEPDVLLFSELPVACGAAAFGSSHAQSADLGAFFRTLKQALAELQRAYDDLLAEIQTVLLAAFKLPNGTGTRETLRSRAQALVDHCVDVRLKAFVLHLSDSDAEDAGWIEAGATMVVGKAPKSWNDTDRIRHEVALTDLVRNFRHLELLVFEQTRRVQSGQQPGQIIRIGVSDRTSRDSEAVVVVERKDNDRLAEAIIELRASLEKLNLSHRPELALAALATVSKQLLGELDKPENRMEHAEEDKEMQHG